MPDFSPAPGSTATSAPSAIIFLTVSGVAATRGSPASTSPATATFMIPPTAANAWSGRWGYWLRAGRFAADRERRPGSDEEIRQQDQNDDDDANNTFHQRDKMSVGLHMRGVVVARRRRVLDLTVVVHCAS